MNQGKKRSRETGAISIDTDLFVKDVQDLNALTRNISSTRVESFHDTDSDDDCPRMNVVPSGSAGRPHKRRRPDSNDPVLLVLDEMRYVLKTHIARPFSIKDIASIIHAEACFE